MKSAPTAHDRAISNPVRALLPVPRVSVVIPAHNAAATVVESMRSALAQTVTAVELIVVDDGSTDGTASIVHRSQQDDPRIALIRLDENVGLSGARNVGIHVARGKWIALLDSDDVWLPEKLEHQLAFAEEHPHLDMIGCYFFERFGASTRGGMRDELWWPSAVLISRRACEINLFNPAWRASEFPEYLSRFDEHFQRDGPQEPLMEYRVGKTGIAHSKFFAERMAWELVEHNRAARKHGEQEVEYSVLAEWYASTKTPLRRWNDHRKWRAALLLRTALIEFKARRRLRAAASGIVGIALDPSGAWQRRSLFN